MAPDRAALAAITTELAALDAAGELTRERFEDALQRAFDATRGAEHDEKRELVLPVFAFGARFGVRYE